MDSSVAGQLGTYTFRISGQLHHRIGSLLPSPQDQPAFAQIFIFGGGGDDEANLRLERSRADLDLVVLRQFQDFLYRYNPYARVFRSAADIIAQEVPRSLRLRSMNDVPGVDHRRYNLPVASDVAVIIEGNGLVGEGGRDIILRREGGGLQRISELHSAYFPLRYPLLFPFGSHQWHHDFRNPTTKREPYPLGFCVFLIEF